MERFEYARKLKLCMNCLRSAGERYSKFDLLGTATISHSEYFRIGRYALSKRLSVLKEDFNTARLRKEQIDMYKKAVFDKLEIEKMLERNGQCSDNDMSSETYATKPSLPPAPTLVEVANYSESLKNNEKMEEVTDDVINQIKNKQILHSPKLKSNLSPRGSPNNGSLRRRNKSAPRNTNYNGDEREISTLRQ